MLVLLDSTILIDYLRGRAAIGRVRSLRDRGDDPCTTGINIEEIVRGLRAAETAAARQLVDGLEIVPIDATDGWQAGTWRREFAARGTTLWQADCLIAAVTRRVGARLATGNPKDFPMPGLEVDHWPVGE